MRTNLSSAVRPLAFAVGMLLAVAAVATSANLNPEWLSRLPVGASLSAGMAGMVVDAGGVTYVTGISGSSSNTDITTAAYAPDGALLWAATWDGPAAWHDQARGIALGPGGRVYVTGNTPGPGSYAQVVVLVYDGASGALLQSVQYSSAPGTSEHGQSVAVDAAGRMFVAGGTVGDGGDVMVVAFDPAGQLLWRRTWDGAAWGPYSQDTGLEVLLGPNGDPVVLNHGVMAALLPDYVDVRYAAATGATVWEATWGVTGGDFARDMEIDAAGDVYVTGTGIDFQDKFSTIKLGGGDGSLLWQAYDWTGYHNGAAALALDGQGGVYVTGSIDPDGDESNLNDNIYTVKRDAQSGALLWTHLYGANCIGCSDFSGDVLVDHAGHVYVAGSSNSPPYSADAILLVLDGATGVETDRGIVSGAALESASWGELRFDAAFNVLVGGVMSNFNTGAVDMAVAKYAAPGGGGIPCADTLSFKAVCVNRAGTGNRVHAYLSLTSSSHQGEPVGMSVDGKPFVTTVDGAGAGIAVRGMTPGPHTVELTDPAGCFAPVTATCPGSMPPLASRPGDRRR
jgi:hypothetical protein